MVSELVVGSGEQDILKGKVKEQAVSKYLHNALLSQIAEHGVKVHRLVIIITVGF